MATVAISPRTTTITLASASAGPFDLDFRLFDDDTLNVYVNGLPRLDWTLSSIYDDGFDDNATITFDTSLAAADVIIIDSAMTPHRDDDYVDGPGLTPKLNIELARMWSSISDLHRDGKRSLRVFNDTDPIVIDSGRTIIRTDDGFGAGPDADEIANAQGYAEDALNHLDALKDRIPFIEDYGDGTFSQANVDAMSAAVGFIRVGSWLTVEENITVNDPIHFGAGAYLSVSSGFTVDIEAAVSSPPQHIFRGAGSVTFSHNSTEGEESRKCHVSWFGAFPGDSASDQSAALQSCSDAMGTTREGEIRFDVGTYYVQAKVTWSRANSVLGAGDRLTNIWSKGSIATAGDVWDTSGVGVMVRGFQFNSDSARTSGAYLRLMHDRCEAYDIYHDNAHEGVALDGQECKAYRTKGLAQSTASGSASVSVQGSRCVVDGVDFTNFASDFPEAVVRVNAQAGSIETCAINNVSGDGDTVGVLVEVGDTYYAKNITIDGVAVERGSDQVRVELTGSGYMDNVSIGSLVASDGGTCFNAVLSGTGDLTNVAIARLTSEGLSDTLLRGSNSSTGIINGLACASIAGSATNNGIYLSGTGYTHKNITIGAAVIKSATDGIEANVAGLSVDGLVTDAPTAVSLTGGADNVRIRGVYTGAGTVLSNFASGANIDIDLTPKSRAIYVEDYGNISTGAGLSSAVDAMEAALSYVRFGPRTYDVTSSITSGDAIPVYFDTGAMLDISTGVTVTIKGRVVAEYGQIIFQRAGTGTVYLNGEAAVTVHPSWWGIYPENGDVAALVNFMFEAQNVSRELFAWFDTGIYEFSTLPDAMPRACRIEGRGWRHTHFKLSGACDNARVFRSSDIAVHIARVQITSNTENTSGEWVYFSHDHCRAEELFFNNHHRAVVIADAGEYCVAKDIYGKRSSATGKTGSALVDVAGDRFLVQQIEGVIEGGTYADTVVKVSGGANHGVVRDVWGAGVDEVVHVSTATGDIQDIVIDSVFAQDTGVGAVSECVKLSTTGSGNIDGVSISGCKADGVTGNAFDVSESSTGRVTNVDLMACKSINETGEKLSISIDEPGEVRVEGGNLTSGVLTISDDAVGTLTPPYIGGVLRITSMGSGSFPSKAHSAQIFFDVGTSLSIGEQITGSSLDVVTSDVTGTDGIDGHTTVAARSGVLKIENRSGGAMVYRYGINAY